MSRLLFETIVSRAYALCQRNISHVFIRIIATYQVWSESRIEVGNTNPGKNRRREEADAVCQRDYFNFLDLTKHTIFRISYFWEISHISAYSHIHVTTYLVVLHFNELICQYQSNDKLVFLCAEESTRCWQPQRKVSRERHCMSCVRACVCVYCISVRVYVCV